MGVNATPDSDSPEVRPLSEIAAAVDNLATTYEGTNPPGAVSTSVRARIAELRALLAAAPSSGAQSPADAELLADLREMRERWARIVVDQSWGDNFDGDFTTLDEVIEALESRRI